LGLSQYVEQRLAATILPGPGLGLTVSSRPFRPERRRRRFFVRFRWRAHRPNLRCNCVLSGEQRGRCHSGSDGRPACPRPRCGIESGHRNSRCPCYAQTLWEVVSHRRKCRLLLVQAALSVEATIEDLLLIWNPAETEDWVLRRAGLLSDLQPQPRHGRLY
jgi:hypothetical protein